MPLAIVRSMIDDTGVSPRCSCGGLIKAAIISFGERIPSVTLRRANEASEQADLFLVIGSSLQVQPAAKLPIIAKQAGAKLAIVNREATPLDHLADITMHRPIGTVFSTLYPQIRNETFASF